MIFSKKNILFLLIQIALTLCFFYALTAGVGFIDWMQVHKWKKVLKLTTFAAAFICTGAAIFLYYKDRAMLATLQPFRLIRAFFNLHPIFSVGFLFVAFFATQLAQQLSMHYALETHLFDFGIFDQVLWNTAHGDFLITSVRGGIHIFAEHFKPILVFIAALYQLINKVWFLLLSTDLMTASSLIAIYLIGREITRSHANSLALTLCVFFYPSLTGGINFLYHTQMLIDPFLLWGFYFILKERRLLALLFFVLALSCKESAVPDVLGLGLFLIASKKRLTGSMVTLMAFLWLFFFLLWIEPQFDSVAHFRAKWNFFGAWANPSWELFSRIWAAPNPATFLFKVLAPFLFLSLACPGWWLLLGPSLLFRALSLDSGLRYTGGHYMGGAEALVFISVIYGFARWTCANRHCEPQAKQSDIGRERLPRRSLGAPRNDAAAKNFLGRVITTLKDPGLLRILIVLVAILFAGCPQLIVINRFLGDASKAETQRVVRVLESIPSNYSVMTTHNLAGQLSHRSHLYVFCEMFPETPYQEVSTHPDLVAYDTRQNAECTVATLQDFLSDGYTQIYAKDDLRIYSLPLNPRVDRNRLSEKWSALASQPIVPYQTIAGFWIRLIAITGGALFVIYLLVGIKNNKKEGS